MNRTHLIVSAAAILAAAACTASAQSRGTWTAVNLHPSAASASQAWDVDDGIIVGEANIGGRRASVWTAPDVQAWVNVHPQFASFSYILSTGGGQHVGAALVDGFSQASLWTDNTSGSWVSLHPAGADFSVGMGGGAGQQVGRARWGVGTPVSAILWEGSAATYVNLHPGGSVTETWGLGAHDGQQVGSAAIGGMGRSSLWTGSAASWIDLTPPGQIASRVERTHSGWQVGMVVVGNFVHAALWNSTPESWVDLNPTGSNDSWLYGVHNGEQVGYAVLDGQRRAGHWSGSAESFVNLHDVLPSGYSRSEARGVWNDGTRTFVVGFARSVADNRNEAFVWIGPTDCYADCNGDGELNIADFLCFIDEFAVAQTLPPAQQQTHYANCTGATSEPFLSVADFLCFIDEFAQGCP